jgi:hypothetical protein
MQTAAQLVANREHLDVVLASAEAALARAVITSADASSGWAEANLKLDNLRTCCRQLRAALVELNRTESTANFDEARAYCRQLRAVLLELDRSASISFHCMDLSCALLLSPRTTCWLHCLDGAVALAHHAEASADDLIAVPIPSPDHAIHPCNNGFSVQETIPGDARVRPSLLRQTIGLLALSFAYLNYYFIEVQLEILNLPLIFTLLLR